MLDYRKVSEYLGKGWTTLDAQQAHEVLESQFMTLDISRLSEAEAREYLDDPDAEAGIYARLSVSGYLDCTDWSGPFPDGESALADLIKTYFQE